MDIDPSTGLTTNYYEHFFDNSTGTVADSIIELYYLGYTTESPMQTLWILAGVFTIGALVVYRKRKQK